MRKIFSLCSNYKIFLLCLKVTQSQREKVKRNKSINDTELDFNSIQYLHKSQYEIDERLNVEIFKIIKSKHSKMGIADF